MALFVQESSTRIRIINPRWVTLAQYGSTEQIPVENAITIGGNNSYTGFGYDDNLTITTNWINACFFNGVGLANGGNAGGPAQDIFVTVKPGRFYRFKAYAFGSNTPEIFELDLGVNTAPWAPGNLIISGVSPTLSWVPSGTDHTSFEILREKETSAGSGTYGSPTTFAVPGTITTYTDTTASNANYKYQVRALNSFGASPYGSSRITAVGTPPSVTLPAAPSNCVATAGTSAITVSWADNSSNETEFEIHRQTLSGTIWGSDVSINVSGGTTAYVDSNITANTYRYQVRAINSAGPSAYTSYSQATFSPAPVIPLAPSNLTATDSGSQSVNLSWSDNSNNETGFEIARQTLSGTTWSSSTLIPIAGNLTSYQDQGTAPGVYRYQIRAINSVGPSAYTAFTQVTVASSGGVPIGSFRATYFNGTNFETQVGTANHAAINFTFPADTSPFPGVNGDNYSIRWEGDWDMQAGTYTFTARTDDGMRVWVDGILIIDAWIDQWPTTYTANKDISAGRHRIRVEFYQSYGPGEASVSWQVGSDVPSAPSNLTATIV